MQARSVIDDATPLRGATICMLLIGDPAHDARVRKEAEALSDAGASVDLVYGAPALIDTDWHWGSSTHVPTPIASKARAKLARVSANLNRERAFDRELGRIAADHAARIYHCHDLNTLRSGLRAARATGALVVYDAHELFTEAGTWKEWRRRSFARFERDALQHVDLVIAANTERARVMRDEYGAPQTPLVIMNSPRSAVIGAEPSGEVIRMREATGASTLLLYQGRVHPARGLDAVIDGLLELPQDTHLAVMGTGDTQGLQKHADEVGVSGRVHLWPIVPADEVVPWAAVADAGIVSYLPVNRNNRLCAPNKLFDYAAAGIAVVASDLSPLRAFLTNHPQWLFEPGNASSFARAARAATHDTDGTSARQDMLVLARANSWETQARKLVDAYEALV